MTPLWIFGYGSLIWRPSIPFDASMPGRVGGFVRRFYQGSTDHRGVVGAPGRVVTLLPDPQGDVAGVAYRVREAERVETMARLDHREKGGYERRLVTVHPLSDGAPVEALVYIATEENSNYLGPASVDAIAAQVRSSRGPSGENIEYVVELARALRSLGVVDAHVNAIEAALGD